MLLVPLIATALAAQLSREPQLVRDFIDPCAKVDIFLADLRFVCREFKNAEFGILRDEFQATISSVDEPTLRAKIASMALYEALVGVDEPVDVSDSSHSSRSGLLKIEVNWDVFEVFGLGLTYLGASILDDCRAPYLPQLVKKLPHNRWELFPGQVYRAAGQETAHFIHEMNLHGIPAITRFIERCSVAQFGAIYLPLILKSEEPLLEKLVEIACTALSSPESKKFSESLRLFSHYMLNINGDSKRTNRVLLDLGRGLAFNNTHEARSNIKKLPEHIISRIGISVAETNSS